MGRKLLLRLLRLIKVSAYYQYDNSVRPVCCNFISVILLSLSAVLRIGMIKTFAVVLTLIALLPFIAVAKPANYDECILDNIGSAQTDAAVSAVRRACSNLFPKPEEKTFEPVEAKYKWKNFNLTQVNSDYTGSAYEVDIINDTEHLVSDVYLAYKNLTCDIPTSSAIAQVQKKLNAKGYSAGRVDGKMGNQTVAALKKFQRSLNTNADGKIIVSTLKALKINTEIGWSTTKNPGFILIAPGDSKRIKFNVSGGEFFCSYPYTSIKIYE